MRTNAIICAIQNPINSFDVDAYELQILSDDQIAYYDVRHLSTSIEVNGETSLKFFDRQPYTYLKTDRHRIGIMSDSSLLFKNHGEINHTSK